MAVEPTEGVDNGWQADPHSGTLSGWGKALTTSAAALPAAPVLGDLPDRPAHAEVSDAGGTLDTGKEIASAHAHEKQTTCSNSGLSDGSDESDSIDVSGLQELLRDNAGFFEACE